MTKCYTFLSEKFGDDLKQTSIHNRIASNFSIFLPKISDDKKVKKKSLLTFSVQIFHFCAKLKAKKTKKKYFIVPE